MWFERLTFGQVVDRAAERWGHREALWFEGRRWSFADFRDEEGLLKEAQAAAREGFTGKLAIHPAQVAVINAAFTPGAEEVDHARAIVEAFDAEPNAGVLSVGGRMVDRPHLVQARRVLDRAR